MSWCDAHHITPRSQGGPATLGNLVLLCRRHHRAVHQHGWQLSLDTDTGRVTVRRGGDVFTSDAHAERALRAPPPPQAPPTTIPLARA